MATHRKEVPIKEKRMLQELEAELKATQLRLEEAEETLRAIGNNEVDALVIDGVEGQQVFTLQGAERPYRTLMETMSEGALTVAADGMILYCNGHFSEMVEMPLNMIIGASIYHLVVSSNGQSLVAMLQACGKEDCRGDFFLKTAKGGEVPVSLSARSLLMNDMEAFCIVATDLTDQKHAQEALKEAYDHLSDAMNLARIVYWEADPTDNMFIFNDTFYAFYRTTAEQEGGYRMTREEYTKRFVHPDDQQLVRRFMKRNNTEPDPLFSSDFEHRIIRRDGEELYIVGRVNVVKDGSGHVVKRYGSNQDITERRKVEMALAESEERYRTAMECSNDGIAIAKGGLNIYVNRKFLEMFGFEEPEEVLGKPATIIAHPEDRKVLMEMSRKRRKREYVPDRYEFRGLHKDGRVVFIEVSAAIFMYRGEAHSLAFLRDITRRKKAEEELAETAEKLRKSLAGTLQAMAHTVEIRDPYTAGHEKRVSALARSIAQEMGLSNAVVNNIRMAGAIHDIGKMSVPAEILSKPTKLSEIEMDLIKIHSQAGYDILTDSQLPYPVAEIVLQHHERLNGSGYPQGLKGDAILLEAQIIAIADTVEAMASHRPYRPALGIDAALEQIEKDKGIFYNADAVNACQRLFKEKGFAFG